MSNRNIALIAGVSGCGKTTVCRRLLGVHYLAIDELSSRGSWQKHDTYRLALAEASNQPLPVVCEATMNVSTTIRRNPDYAFKLYVIIEPLEVVLGRLHARGGNARTGIYRRMRRMEQLSATAHFHGTADEVMRRLAGDLRVKLSDDEPVPAPRLSESYVLPAREKKVRRSAAPGSGRLGRHLAPSVECPNLSESSDLRAYANQRVIVRDTCPEHKRQTKMVPGEVIGHLTVVGYAGRRVLAVNGSGDVASNAALVTCRCRCGKEIELPTPILATAKKAGRAASCGCAFSERLRSATRKPRLPEGMSSFRKVLRAYKRTATERGLPFTLTDKEFMALTSSNCYYCGCAPANSKGNWRMSGAYVYNGVDRVDNTLGYTSKNTITACGNCNRAKSDRLQAQFLSWARAVAARHPA